MRALLLALAALLALAPAASAHDHVMVHEVYEFTIGFETEPAVVDQPNAVSLRVKGPFDSGNLSAGQSFSFTFHSEGTFRYHCHLHPWQQGNVTVGHGGHGHGAARVHHVEIRDGATNGAYRYSPENLVIQAGETVVWHNNGTMVHTVSEGAPSQHGHGGHGHGGDHGHAATHPVTGLEKTLKVTVSTGGESVELALQPKFRDPGHYVGRFIPTVPGVYTFHFKGTVGGKAVDLVHPYGADPVVGRGDLEFPAKGVSNADTAKRLDDLSKAQAEGGRNAPAPAALALLAGLAAAVLVAARRR